MKKHIGFFIICALIPLIIFLSPIFAMNKQQPEYFDQLFEDAKVLEILKEELNPDPVVENRFLGSQRVKLEILTGKYKGKIFEADNPLSTSHNIVAEKGMVLIAGITDTDGNPTAWIYNYKSDGVLIFLAGLFFFLLLLFGGMKGLKSAISLILTGVIVIFFMLPLIFQGKSPVLVAVFAASLAAISSFILIGGFHKKTYAAILGTICGVSAAGFISWIAGEWAHVSGVTMENSQQLLYLAKDYQIKIRGLMFTSILISSLGAVMDVAMSIASSTFEIHQANPKFTPKQLLQASMNVGKDIMGTMADTLILAFAGGAFNTIMLIWGFQMNYRQFINIPLVKTEIIQSLGGSIGIILTVPVTAFFAVTLYKKSFLNSPGVKPKTKTNARIKA